MKLSKKLIIFPLFFGILAALGPADQFAQAATTMSKSTYSGKDKAVLEKKIATAYNERYAMDTVIKVVITEPTWRVIKKRENGVVSTKKIIAAQVAVDLGEKAKVWQLTFELLSNGVVELNSIGESFKIDKADINK